MPGSQFKDNGGSVKGHTYTNIYDRYFQVSTLEFFYKTLPWQWFKAQGIAESSLNPEAVSPVGAFGIMQLMPDTEKDMAKKLGTVPSPLPHTNIRFGIAYDRRCWNIWKKEDGIERIRFMLGSYNAGPGHIVKAQKIATLANLPSDKWQSITMALPEVTGRHSKETIDYVAKIERLFEQLTTREKKA